MRLRTCLLFGAVALLTACGEPTIDASSDETLKSSIETVRKSLPAHKQEEFNQAVKVLAFSQVDLKGLFIDGASGIDTTQAKMKDVLDGKTADELITEVENVKKARERQQRAQALEEILELEKKKTAADEARNELSKFEVLRSRFYKQKQKYTKGQPVIELTVKNGTGQAVSRAYFNGTLASPGRAVPWLEKTFNYSISGGLEPEEKASWKLSPNQFSEWGTVKNPPDAILTVQVERLDGPDGEALFSTRGFSERDADRLKELKAKYAGKGSQPGG